MIEAVLFDYGGTLVKPTKPFEEVKPAAVGATHALLRGNGLDMSYDEFLEFNNSIFRRYTDIEKESRKDIPDLIKYQELVDTLFPTRSSAWRKNVARQADEAFWGVIVRNYPIRKNAKRTLSRLKSMNIRLGVISNHHNHESLVGHLRDLGILSNFSHVISSAKSGIRKPDVRIFETGLSSMRVRNPGRSIFVGDSLENDVEGAKSAGMYAILIVDGMTVDGRDRKSRTKPDFTIRDLAEILPIVSSHRRSA